LEHDLLDGPLKKGKRKKGGYRDGIAYNQGRLGRAHKKKTLRAKDKSAGSSRAQGAFLLLKILPDFPGGKPAVADVSINSGRFVAGKGGS